MENKDSLLDEFIDKKIHTYDSIINKLKGKSSQEIDSKISKSKSNIDKLKSLK